MLARKWLPQPIPWEASSMSLHKKLPKIVLLFWRKNKWSALRLYAQHPLQFQSAQPDFSRICFHLEGTQLPRNPFLSKMNQKLIPKMKMLHKLQVLGAGVCLQGDPHLQLQRGALLLPKVEGNLPQNQGNFTALALWRNLSCCGALGALFTDPHL